VQWSFREALFSSRTGLLSNGSRLLVDSIHGLLAHPRGALPTVIRAVTDHLPIELIGERSAGDRCFSDVVVAEHRGRHGAAV
jgi:hypothetical protein